MKDRLLYSLYQIVFSTGTDQIYVPLVLFLLLMVVILVTLSFHNCSFSMSVCLLSILFLVTACSLPSLGNKRHHIATHFAVVLLLVGRERPLQKRLQKPKYSVISIGKTVCKYTSKLS